MGKRRHVSTGATFGARILRSLRPTCLALVVPVTLWSVIVGAQPHDPAAALTLAKEAYELKLLQKWEEARLKFEESERLDPSGKTLINLAECEEHVGQRTSAQQHLADARDMLGDESELRGIAIKRLAMFERLPPLVTPVKNAPVPKGVGRTCLNGGDPWDGEVEITWRGPVCSRGSRLALEGGDPWMLASMRPDAPSGGTAPQNLDGGEPVSPLPRLLAPKLDQVEPWARLRPAVRFLRWPSARDLLASRGN